MASRRAVQSESASVEIDYESIFEHAPTALAVFRVTHEVVLVAANAAMLGELGLLASEAQDRRIEELRLGDATAMLAAAIRSAHDRARPARLMVESFGEAVGVRHEVAALPIAGPGSVLLRVLPSTGRAPRLSALTLDQLEALGDGQIFVFDIRRQRMRYLASELAHMIGHSMESPLDLSQIRSLIHVQDREAVEQYFENLGPLGGALVSSVTLRLARPEGGWRWLEVRGRALSLEPDGKARTVLGVAVDITERRTMSLALDRAARAVLRAGEVERRRVVRNLHDSLAQHLVGIDLGLSRLGRHVIPTADTSAITRDIRSALSAAHREVRTYSYLLHPPQLERQGLESALGALLDGFGRRADLAVRMEVSGQPQQVGAEVELALFRVAQEAIMNIHRHAQASRVTLRLERSPQRLTLEVEDDGVGMPEDAELTEPRQDGVGIPGMMARLAQMGGALELERPARGVCLRASVPI